MYGFVCVRLCICVYIKTPHTHIYACREHIYICTYAHAVAHCSISSPTLTTHLHIGNACQTRQRCRNCGRPRYKRLTTPDDEVNPIENYYVLCRHCLPASDLFACGKIGDLWLPNRCSVHKFPVASIQLDTWLSKWAWWVESLHFAPTEMIDRSFKIDFETFKKGWLKMFEGKSEDSWQPQSTVHPLRFGQIRRRTSWELCLMPWTTTTMGSLDLLWQASMEWTRSVFRVKWSGHTPTNDKSCQCLVAGISQERSLSACFVLDSSFSDVFSLFSGVLSE